MLVDSTTSITYVMVELKNEDVFLSAKKQKGELYEVVKPLDLIGKGGSSSAKSVRQLYMYLKKNGWYGLWFRLI